MDTFHQFKNRRNTRSVKWDGMKEIFGAEDLIPLWIADMDFEAPQEVIEALAARAKHGIFGYTLIDSDITAAIVEWIQHRHGWTISESWLSFGPSVVAGLQMAIQAFTEPQDKVLIQTPVYTPFFNVIKQHGRELVSSPLIEKNGHYEIDFADFEQKLKTGVKAFILCSPHNPTGRVWRREELERMAELCLQYNVLMLSDEIHCDLIYPGHKHIPLASLSPEIAHQTITFMSPSKSFNLAGLQASYMITKDDSKRRKLNQMLEKQGHKQLNTMGNTALATVYQHGEAWLEELLNLLDDNRKFVIETFHEQTPELRVIQPEGTYLLWFDCADLGLDSTALQTFMVEKAKVGLNPGITYGEEGRTFMRMNIACHRETLEEAVHRIVQAVRAR